jgi:hypothetical protein
MAAANVASSNRRAVVALGVGAFSERSAVAISSHFFLPHGPARARAARHCRDLITIVSHQVSRVEKSIRDEYGS